MKIAAYTPEQVAATALDPELVAELDDGTLRLSLDAASEDDQHVLMAEMVRRGLEV